MSRATHLPAWHSQRPPQSIVPGAQCMVQATSRQSGADARGTHAAGWQQVEGTQSASARQAAGSMGADAGSFAHAIAPTSSRIRIEPDAVRIRVRPG